MTETLERQFYLHLFDHSENLTVQQMKVRTLQCFARKPINSIPRIDFLLQHIALFRRYKYDNRRWLLTQERILEARRAVLVREVRQAQLF